jgi:uncharacterized membrane protein required for colicin V production
MTKVDWGVVVIVGLAALGGYRRGLIGSVLSLIGLFVGATVGARVAPPFMSGATSSQYSALVGLAGAFVGVLVGRLIASIIAKFIRGGLHLLPPLHLLDSLGGLVVGALWGFVLVWIAGAVALQLQGHSTIRHDVLQSKILRRLDKIAPPHDVLRIPQQFGAIALRLGD